MSSQTLSQSPIAAPRGTGFLRARVAGHPLRWSRDLAFVGATTSGFAPLMVTDLAPHGYAAISTLVGLLTGGALGVVMPAALDRVRGRVSLLMLLALAALTGLAWGGLTGALSGLPFGDTNAFLGLCAGGVTGALQFGWLWFPYTFQSVRRCSTWPVIALSVVALPFVSAAGIMATITVALSGMPPY